MSLSIKHAERRAVCQILEPHDHLHISQKRTSRPTARRCGGGVQDRPVLRASAGRRRALRDRADQADQARPPLGSQPRSAARLAVSGRFRCPPADQASVPSARCCLAGRGSLPGARIRSRRVTWPAAAVTETIVTRRPCRQTANPSAPLTTTRSIPSPGCSPARIPSRKRATRFCLGLLTEPGDYAFVPPYVLHREENPGAEEAVVIIASSVDSRVNSYLDNTDRLYRK